LSEDYGKRIKRAANLMSRSMDAYATKYGLTGTQMSIIDFLGESQDHTQRDIEMEFDIRPSTTTKILQRMEASGLVAAKRDPRDGRQRIIAPTPRPVACRKPCGHISTTSKRPWSAGSISGIWPPSTACWPISSP